jgi:TonB family protein
MASWMIYSGMIGALAWIGALCLEPIAAARGLPRRIVWIGAFALALGWPAVNAALRARPAQEDPGVAARAFTIVVGPVLSSPTPATRLPRPMTLERALMVGWGALSAMCALRLLIGVIALKRRRRAWRRDRVDDADVRIARDDGPALVGLRRMEVVLPEWILTLDEPLRAMVLCHEHEHRRARDPHLIFAAAIAITLMPWNVALWLMNRRVRLAIEMDCDARVLRVHPCPERYGLLILAVAQRRSTSARLLFAPDLSQPATYLERRIFAMYSSASLGRRTTLAAATVALTTFAVACALRTVPAPVVASPTADRVALDAFMSAQGFASWSYARPVVGNRPPRYPDSLRQAQSGGTVLAQFVVDTVGRVDGNAPITILASTSELLSASVREALPAMRFVPAEVDGRKVKQLAQVPFEFLTDGDRGRTPTAADSAHRTVDCQKGSCPVLRLELVVVTAARR